MYFVEITYFLGLLLVLRRLPCGCLCQYLQCVGDCMAASICVLLAAELSTLLNRDSGQKLGTLKTIVTLGFRVFVFRMCS